MSVAVEPIRDWVLLRVLPETHTDGGLVLPDGVKLKSRAEVVAVGDGHLTESGTVVPLRVAPGDYVIARHDPSHPAWIIERDPANGDLILMKELCILAVDRRPRKVDIEIAPGMLQ